MGIERVDSKPSLHLNIYGLTNRHNFTAFLTLSNHMHVTHKISLVSSSCTNLKEGGLVLLDPLLPLVQGVAVHIEQCPTPPVQALKQFQAQDRLHLRGKEEGHPLREYIKGIVQNTSNHSAVSRKKNKRFEN